VLTRLHGPIHATIANRFINKGILLDAQDCREDALSTYTQALVIFKQLHGDNVDHENIAKSLNAIAFALNNLNRVDEADDMFKQALTMRKRLYGQEHQLVAESLTNLGLIQRITGQWEEALVFLLPRHWTK